MEDEFAEIYQRQISWIEPDLARFRHGLQTIRCITAGADPPEFEAEPLQSVKKYGIQGTKACTRSGKTKEDGERT